MPVRGQHLPSRTPLPPGSIELWRARVEQQIREWYAGVRIKKSPEDLRVFEHLLWDDAASVVIEIGTNTGGSALWFRDRLHAMVRYGRIAGPRVITLDLEVDKARAAFDGADPHWRRDIVLLAGDVTDPALADEVAAHVPEGARCLVVEDSAHVYDTTHAALTHFARFVSPGGYFVVEDAVVDDDELRLSEHWPRGVADALTDWLGSPAGAEFLVRRDLELYGLTNNPGGILQRRGAENVPVAVASG